MRLSRDECILILRALKSFNQRMNDDNFDKKHYEKLIVFLTEVTEAKKTSYELKEERNIDIPLEEQLDDQIAELITLKSEIDKKLDLERKVYANAMKPIVMFFIDLAKLTLSMSAVCAICYTISKVIPQEWAIWMPIPIIAILGVVYLVQMYYESWHHGHWK